MEYAVNQRIKMLRSHLGISQNDFGNKVKVSSVTIYQIENEASKPSSKTIQKIIEKTGVNRDWLLHGKGELVIDENVRVEDSENKTSWSSRAYEAVKSKNEHLENEVKYLREMLRMAISQKAESNFQDDINHAGLFLKEKSVDIVRAAA